MAYFYEEPSHPFSEYLLITGERHAENAGRAIQKGREERH